MCNDDHHLIAAPARPACATACFCLDRWKISTARSIPALEANGASRTIGPGDVVVAPTGSVHGVVNTGTEPLVFISVVSPAEAGYELV